MKEEDLCSFHIEMWKSTNLMIGERCTAGMLVHGVWSCADCRAVSGPGWTCLVVGGLLVEDAVGVVVFVSISVMASLGDGSAWR